MTVVMRSMASISFAISRGMYDYEEDLHDEGVMIARQGIVMMTCIKISLHNVIPILDDLLEELRAEENREPGEEILEPAKTKQEAGQQQTGGES